jgi:AraC-like DNA-binding protein
MSEIVSTPARRTAPGLPRVVGRDQELAEIARAIEHRHIRWITGPAGIGKTALVRDSLEGLRAVELAGAWMKDAVEAVQVLTSLVHGTPAAPSLFEVSRWLAERLPQLGEGAVDVLVWDDFHLVDRGIASLVLRLLKDLELPYAVLLVGQEYWTGPGLVTRRLRQLRLWELDEQGTAQFCGRYGRAPGNLPDSIVGHPLLMSLYLEHGIASTDEWVDTQLLAEHSPLASLLPLVKKLCLVRSPVQLVWATQAHAGADLQRLEELGVWHREGPLLAALRESLLDRMQVSGQRRELESSLLGFLLGQRELGGGDVLCAARLMERLEAWERAGELVAKTSGADTSREGECGHAQFLLQPALVRILAHASVPSALKLSTYRALMEHIQVHELDELLAAHDHLVTSPSRSDRHLAKVCFLRAAFMSGLRDLPAQAQAYWTELQDAEDLADALKEQLLHLWVFRRLHIGPGGEGEGGVQALLLRLKAPAAARPAFVLLCEAVDLCWQLRVEDAIPKLEASREAFADAGLPMHAEWSCRYLLVLYYLRNRDADVERMLRRIETSPLGNVFREFWYVFFRAQLGWSRGSLERIEAQCPPRGKGPQPSPHPLLPGPYFRDYFPYCFAAIRDRSRNTPPDAELATVLAEALSRLHLFVPVMLSGVAYAQHCLLHNDTTHFARLNRALLQANPIAAMHGVLLSSFAELGPAGGTTAAIVSLLERATLVTERLATPYYVVLATRAVLRHGLDRGPLVAFLDESRNLAQLEGQAAWILAICRSWLLGVQGRTNDPGDPMPWLRHSIAFHFERALPGTGDEDPRVETSDPTLSRLVQHIDEHWFEDLRLAAFADAQGLSRFALTRKFKARVGMSPKQYQQTKRIEQAKCKLLDSAWDVSAIAYECGYSDAAQFARLFKRDTGLTPTGYRATLGYSLDRSKTR